MFGSWLLKRFVRSLLAGTMLVIALTSFSSAVSSMRWGRAAEPCVWISNLFGTTQSASIVWNLLLAGVFGLAAAVTLVVNPLRRSIGACLSLMLAIAAVLAGADTIVFVKLLRSGEIVSSWPIPLSLVVAGLSAIGACVVIPTRSTSEPPNLSEPIFRHILFTAVTLASMFLGQLVLVWLHVETFGSTDYRREADVAVVLGARVYSDGTLSMVLEDRLNSAAELFQTKLVSRLLVTGATGKEGINEATAMRSFLIARGIPAECILTDEEGFNTLASAKNVRRLMSEHSLATALVVSHDFHLARCKLLFEEQGIRCVTVPAKESRRLLYESYFTSRECIGYLWYALTRPLRAAPR